MWFVGPPDQQPAHMIKNYLSNSLPPNLKVHLMTEAYYGWCQLRKLTKRWEYKQTLKLSTATTNWSSTKNLATHPSLGDQTQGDCNLPVAPGDIDPCCHWPVRPRNRAAWWQNWKFQSWVGRKRAKGLAAFSVLVVDVGFLMIMFMILWLIQPLIHPADLDTLLWWWPCGWLGVALKQLQSDCQVYLLGWEICFVISMTKLCYFCSCVQLATTLGSAKTGRTSKTRKCISSTTWNCIGQQKFRINQK